MKLALNKNIRVQQPISESMFGSNQLFRFDTVSNSGSIFPSAADLLGITSLRYPGGTMTEANFDVTAPDNAPKGVKGSNPFIGATEFLNFAKSTSRDVNFVVPTKPAYSGAPNSFNNEKRQIDQKYIDETVAFVRNLLTKGDSGASALPDTEIATIEIGNEYWGGGKMTASEYGKLVNILLPKIHEVISECVPQGTKRPQLLVQVGAPVDDQFKTGIYSNLSYSERLYLSNLNIISEISDPRAKIAIGGLVDHYYYNGTTDILQKNTWSMQSMDQCYDIWELHGYTGIDYHITEWNVNMNNPVQLGLRGASILIEQFTYMTEIGVDAAFAWPIQNHNNGLVRSAGSDVALSPIGAAFKLMSESLTGTSLLPYEIQGESVEVSIFGNESKAVVFIYSRIASNQEARIDISSAIKKFKSLEGIKLSVEQGERFDNPFAPASLTLLNPMEILENGEFKLALAPFEIVRLELGLYTSKFVKGSGENELLQGGVDSDTLLGDGGNDIILGGDGFDVMHGNMGNDRVLGGNGEDTIFGGYGMDTLRGGPGADIIHGNFGNDILIAVAGGDTLYGGFGSDTLRGGSDGSVLFGGPGNDQLFGLGGGDTLQGGLGTDFLYGGSGSDVFILEMSSQWQDVIFDFDSHIDRIQVRWNPSIGGLLGADDIKSLTFHDGQPANSGDGVFRIFHNRQTGSLYCHFDDGSSNDSGILIGTVWSTASLGATNFEILLSL